jgi:hypothetical protein
VSPHPFTLFYLFTYRQSWPIKVSRPRAALNTQRNNLPMKTESTSPVLTRIAKLLALANSKGATEAEAALAAEHVQRLLQEHNLTLSQVEAQGGSSDTTSAARAVEKTDLSAARRWRVIIMRAVAEGNFCLHQITKRGYRRTPVHTLVGRDINVRASVLTYEYLVTAATRLLRESSFSTPGSKSPNEWRNEQYFLEGIANRLSERLEERRAEQERASAAATRPPTAPAGNSFSATFTAPRPTLTTTPLTASRPAPRLLSAGLRRSAPPPGRPSSSG